MYHVIGNQFYVNNKNEIENLLKYSPKYQHPKSEDDFPLIKFTRFDLLKPRILVEHARLVSRNHVFDVDEGIFTPVAFQDFQRLLDHVSGVLPLLLAVIDSIPTVDW